MMLVMLGVFAGLQYYRSRNTQPVQQNTAQTQSAAVSGAAKPSSAPATPATAAAQNTPAVAATAETTTTVENELYKVVFSNRGGEVRSWIVKRQKDRITGQPLDLVNDVAAKEFGYPLSLYTYDANLTNTLKSAMFVPSATGTITAPGTLSFHYSANGVDVTKTFSFDSTYVISARAEVKVNGAPVRALLSWPAAFGDQDQVNDFGYGELNTMRNGSADAIAAKKVSGGETLNAPLDYAGVADQYFAATFMPADVNSATAVELHNTIDVQKLRRNGVPAGKSVNVPVLGIAVGSTAGPVDVRIFVGPKSVDTLRSIKTADGHTLEPLVNFGFWGPFAKFLFVCLNFTHDHIASNWGWAIVVLTVFLNILMLPFRYQTMKSGLKMQRIQPQMDAIKAKYAKYKVTDPKRADMNAEIMQLQKDNGVNMFGGCIPTLLTFPLLFAMYSMLPRVVELRSAHWFWLHDLTAADPLHILPITMVLSQFLVQFYMPSPGVDPQQQKMMAFMMPLFSGYITWNYSSGLALYWCVGNLIMIAAQYAMNQTKEGREMREIAAKRARRKAGTSTKVIQGRR